MPVAVFDINETTLDLAPVRDVVDDILADRGGFPVWFARVLQLSTTLTTTGDYVDFPVLARSALDAIAEPADDTAGSPADDTAGEARWQRVGAAFGGLSAHPDVARGLDSLRAAGWTLVALTNSSQASVESQLAGAGIADRFDHVLSVEQVRTFKPSAAPYRHALEVVDADPADAWMVACHDWDLAGAAAVGMATAAVRRPGATWAGVLPTPTISVDDMVELAARLTA